MCGEPTFTLTAAAEGKHVTEKTKRCAWLPEAMHTQEGALRRVGVELEFTNLSKASIVAAVQQQFGGECCDQSQFECRVTNTEVGDFKVELDARFLKEVAKQRALTEVKPSTLNELSWDVISQVGEQLVPWEVVSPPIAVDRLPRLMALVTELRQRGAKGTRDSVLNAFGVHLNPELPSLSVETILHYFKAYLCLYDWIVEQEQIDFSRRLMPFISHFDRDYIQRVIDPTYQPSITVFIEDYLHYNPTRNRSLDLLPLCAHLNPRCVASAIDDVKIKARPTFHYRLPNCDIDNPFWNLHIPWQCWLQVEALAQAPARLQRYCRQYSEELERFTYPIEDRWLNFLLSDIKPKELCGHEP